MSTSSDSGPGGPRNEVPPEHTVFVVPQDAILSRGDEDVDLLELWDVVWSGRWAIVGITAALLSLAVAYAFTATPWYRAETLLAPADEQSTRGVVGQLSGLAGLAGLAGIGVGGGGNAESIAILRSRDFARPFIEERKLLSVFFAEEWDDEAGRWRSTDPESHPDIRDAVDYFDENVRSVSEDTQTNLVTLAIEWTDADVAAEWANTLVARLNDYMRQRALVEAEANVAYLRQELSSTNVATLLQSVGVLLETELQKLMLARGNDEFAFRVIDRAEVPKRSQRPRRILIIGSGFVFGAALSVVLVLLRHAVRKGRSRSISKSGGTTREVS